MIKEISIHSISPNKVIRGENAWEEGKHYIPSICKRPLILGRSKATSTNRELLFKDLKKNGLKPIKAELKYDCCDYDLNRIIEITKNNNCDCIISAGGGKVLDSGKLVANRLSIPCITVPLSASTCAGWTSLSNIYTTQGAFIKDELLEKCPDLLIFDHSFVREAPQKTLASGIADALAKWYESSITSTSSEDGIVQHAVQMARVLRDQILIDAENAFLDSKSDAWVRIAEGCALTAGVIGGIGGAKCRTAAAHAIHNGLTQLNNSEGKLHGEIVGFGILAQLRLEEIILCNQLAKQARLQLLPFLKKLNLPTKLKDLGIRNGQEEELMKACEFSCKKCPDMKSLPFNVTENVLIKALISTEKESHPLEMSNQVQRKSLEY